MTDRIDRILAESAELEPSSRLTRAIMQRVFADAQAPPPIPFPWRRLALGTGVALGLVLCGLLLGVFDSPATGTSSDLPPPRSPSPSQSRF